MSGQALKGGTAYEVTGGKTLVSSTEYDIAGGKTLIGGTGYDISFLSPHVAKNIWGTGSSYEQEITCIAYGNGYWVVGGRYRSGSMYYAAIAYATSLDGTWTTKTLWGVSNYSNNCINCITYAKGYWVVGGEYQTSSIYRSQIAYAASLPRATWTTITISSNNSGKCTINSVKYLNSTWVCGGYYYTGSVRYGQVGYCTSSTPSSWTTNTIWNGSYGYEINDITYANGYWVVAGKYGTSSTTYAAIAYCTSISSSQSSWTTVRLWGYGYQNNFLNCIEYANGYIIAGGVLQSANSTYSGSISYVASTPTGTWSNGSLIPNSSYGYCGITSIKYANGYWVACGVQTGYSDSSTVHRSVISYGTTIGSGTLVQVHENTNSNTGFNDIVYENGYWVTGGSLGYYANICYATKPASFAT